MQTPTFFDTPIAYLKGVGPQRAEVLQSEFGIRNFGDLIRYFPFRYVDRSRFFTVSEINPDMPYVQLRGFISTITAHGHKRATRLTAQFRDSTGTIELVWFQGVKWLRESLKPNVEYVVFGKPSFFNGRFNIAHPEMEPYALFETHTGSSLTGVYNTSEKAKAKFLDTKAIMRLQRMLQSILPQVIPDSFPIAFLQEWKLMGLRDALCTIHFPADERQLEAAIRRLKFEELFFLQMRLLRVKKQRDEKLLGKLVPKIGDFFNTFYQDHLPFELTNAQKRVLKEIRSDMGSGRQMNRLVQGDVGSGKTIVALLSMLMVIDNGMQACMMAPTEILAQQHYASISELLKDTDIRIGLLTGSTKTSHRNFLLNALEAGELQLLIGTHALIEDRVQFKELGLVVIDEQHRFGVEQRARLWMKDAHTVPHVLVMTATPIPRTLAMTLYGDLDTSVIDELPPGRKPIDTSHRFESARLAVHGFIRKEIAKGRQIYIVYPLIEESEKLDYTNLVQGYETICREFPLPDYRVSIVHGRMKAAEKDAEMQRFKDGKTHIMVATTVIEVGVNVPNASVMIIESAERFGLSQLHQLRGRVGRGADQSYCILMTGNKLSADARLRMKTMCATNNGFEIAETDLKLRGPGDIIGTQQSGVIDLRIADLSKDVREVEESRQAASEILKNDAGLQLPENARIREQLARIDQQQLNFSRVS